MVDVKIVQKTKEEKNELRVAEIKAQPWTPLAHYSLLLAANWTDADRALSSRIWNDSNEADGAF